MKPIKRRIAAGAAGVVLLAAAGGAYAATQSTPDARRAALLDDAAKRLNVSPQALRNALQGASADQLDAAVKDGTLTQQQADRIRQRAQAEGTVPFLGGGPRGWGGPDGHGGRGHFGRLGLGPRTLFGSAADYLGLTHVQLRAQLEAGKSLADVAKARDKDLAGLKSALEDAATSALDADVKAGRLTTQERDRITADLAGRIDELVQRTGPDRPHGPGLGHP